MKDSKTGVDHGELHFLKRENEVIILHQNKEIATLTVQTMTNPDETFSDNFFLIFNADKDTLLDKNIVEVWTKQ